MDQKFDGLPTTAVASPVPPSTVGKLDQPSWPAETKSAALEENPSAKPPASTSCWIIVFAWMTAGSDQAFGLFSWIAWKTSGPPIRSVRYSNHINCGHLLC